PGKTCTWPQILIKENFGSVWRRRSGRRVVSGGHRSRNSYYNNPQDGAVARAKPAGFSDLGSMFAE
ncbi:hypothetical protein RRG08_065303, partial [Elysia crispata]